MILFWSKASKECSSRGFSRLFINLWIAIRTKSVDKLLNLGLQIVQHTAYLHSYLLLPVGIKIANNVLAEVTRKFFHPEFRQMRHFWLITLSTFYFAIIAHFCSYFNGLFDANDPR